MTSLKSIATTIAVTAGLVASNLTVLATSAKAYDHRAYGYNQHRSAPPRHVERFRHQAPAPRHHGRDRTGDAVGAAVIGIGALIVGAAIADAARRESRERRYESDED